MSRKEKRMLTIKARLVLEKFAFDLNLQLPRKRAEKRRSRAECMLDGRSIFRFRSLSPSLDSNLP